MSLHPQQTGPGTYANDRESARRGMVRSNQAIAAILVLVFLLGLAMLAASYHALTDQRRAESAEAAATERLWNSYLAQARAERLNIQAGHRAAALEAVSNAAVIRPSVELRDEALAAFGLRDLVREISWPLQPRAYGFHFDPEVQCYVVSYADDELSLFRLADNTLVRTFRAGDAGLGTNAAVREFCFSATGRYVLVQYSTGEIVLWERDSGHVVQVFGRDGKERLVWLPTFSSDDQTMCALKSGSATVILRDMSSGATREIQVEGINETLRFSPRGDVFTRYTGKRLILHSARDGAVKRTVELPAEIMSSWWDWRGDQISVWCGDSTVHVLNAHTGQSRQLGGRVAGPWMQQFSPDGSMLITSGNDGISRLWDLSDTRVLAQTTEGRAFVFARDGERIAFGVPGVKVGVWRITKPIGYRLIEGTVTHNATVWYQDLSENGRWIAWALPPWLRTHGFELFFRETNRTFIPTPHPIKVGFHPTENQLVLADKEGMRLVELPKSFQSGAPQFGVTNRIALPPNFEPQMFSFNGDGKRAVVASTGGKLVVLDLNQPGSFVFLDGTLKRSGLPGPASSSGSGSFAISPDGRWVVAGRDTRSGAPTVWDARSGRVVQELATSASHVGFSPDGRWLVSVSASSCIVWAVDGWRVHWKSPRPALVAMPGAAAFSSDSAVLAFTTSLGDVEVAESASGERIATISGGKAVSIAGLRFASDGRRLIASGNDGLISVWDLRALRTELKKLDLDWPGNERAQRAIATEPKVITPVVLGALGLSAVGLTAVLGMVVLRRQTKLTTQFVQTTETAAQQARELAAERELSELKSRFVSLVSHEFRTPLGITMSAVELLRNYADRLSREKLNELLDDIYSSTLRMSGLMEQVLLIGRVDAGKLTYKSAPIDLPQFAAKLVDETLSATNRRCPVKLKLDGDLTRAQGDEGLLRHIFSNLLSNAVKYSCDRGDVEFVVQRVGADAVFSVRDRGIGIPDADHARLFEAFHRASNVGQTPGTGLGLLIVKRCVDLHGGKISFESREGSGTTFTVRVPLFGS